MHVSSQVLNSTNLFDIKYIFKRGDVIFQFSEVLLRQLYKLVLYGETEEVYDLVIKGREFLIFLSKSFLFFFD